MDEAEKIALEIYPIFLVEDHNVPNVFIDLNEAERNAFLEGVSWQLKYTQSL